MDNYQFNLLKTNDQAAYTWDHGIYLAARNIGDYTVNLYFVDNFFVEVYYNPKHVCIEKISSFMSRKCLEPYLEKIIFHI